MMARNHLNQLCIQACIALTASVAGCKEKAVGPKRADDLAAHTKHYHPDVRRQNPAATEPSAEARPESDPTATQPTGNFFAGGPAGSPVMFVNGESVTVPQILEPIIDELARQSRALSEKDYRDSALRLVRNQIDFQISTLVVYREAKKTYGSDKAQEAFAKRADELIKERINEQYGGIYARYESHLKALEITPAEMKERFKKEAMVKEFFRVRFKPMLREPPRREVLRYYQDHLSDYTTPEKAELLLIELPIEAELRKPIKQAGPQELAGARERARQRMKRAREELESGVDFAAVAKAYSKGAKARQGGSWGEIGPGALTNRWAKPAEVLFTMQPDQISDVIETEEALFIVKCGSRTPAAQLSFEEAQKKIMDSLVDEQFSRLRNEYIRDLLTRATVEKRIEFFRAVLYAVPRPVRYEGAGGTAGG